MIDNKSWLSTFPILLGTAIYAFGLHYFIIPNELMEGGLTGITLLLNYVFGLSPSLMTLLLNIPLFYIGWKLFGTHAIALTVFGTLSLSFFLWVMEQAIAFGIFLPENAVQDPFLVVLYSGVTLGLGLGTVFRFGGTTGGSDIIARIGHRYFGLSMGKVILLIDTIVIGASIFYIAFEQILYTLVVVFIASRTIDLIQEGAHASRAFMIMTERPYEVSESIMKHLDHSTTLFRAIGGFTKKHREVVYCVIYRQEARKLKALVRQHDPNAFIVIQDIQDVHGEGFNRH